MASNSLEPKGKIAYTIVENAYPVEWLTVTFLIFRNTKLVTLLGFCYLEMLTWCSLLINEIS